jgi:hypothetical protein
MTALAMARFSMQQHREKSINGAAPKGPPDYRTSWFSISAFVGIEGAVPGRVT